jgi:hypothetical protein
MKARAKARKRKAPVRVKPCARCGTVLPVVKARVIVEAGKGYDPIPVGEVCSPCVLVVCEAVAKAVEEVRGPVSAASAQPIVP